jgi:calcium-dependent protein kinase
LKEFSSTSNQSKKSKKKNEKAPYKVPAEMESSAATFGDPKINGRRDLQNHPVMITDSISDVRLKYHIQPKEIGHGHYGVVRKCMDRETKAWYAIKSIRKSKVGKVDVLRREVALLKECDHPNIIKLIEVHEDQKYLHLITELCTGGELFDRIIEKTQSDEGHFSERDAAGLVRCILDAISYCHDKAIVHRDLKPENFLFSSKDEKAAVIKIIDFGLSRHDHDVKQGIMNTKVGTPYYVAPEVLNREYTKSCDIWSIGVITYILLCGYPPFYGDTDNQIFEAVRTAKFDFPSPDWDGISDSAKEFICSLLQRTPSKRLTAAQALEHSWIKEMTPQSNGKMFDRMRQQRKSSIAFAPLSIAFIKFRDMQKLKKAALAYLATNATNDDIVILKDVFATIDVKKKGRITLQELDDCLKNRDREFFYGTSIFHNETLRITSTFVRILTDIFTLPYQL